MGYGDQAEVLEPESLRELIAQRAERMLEQYRGQSVR
jgi:predicted DNA-binding transcriptional regulator YafY